MPLPALGARQSIDDLVATAGGLLFTSSYSNVRRHHYGGGPSPRGTVHNAARDATGPSVAHRLPRRMPERYPR
jgi:putative glutamine amidotransferase